MAEKYFLVWVMLQRMAAAFPEGSEERELLYRFVKFWRDLWDRRAQEALSCLHA